MQKKERNQIIQEERKKRNKWIGLSIGTIALAGTMISNLFGTINKQQSQIDNLKKQIESMQNEKNIKDEEQKNEQKKEAINEAGKEELQAENKKLHEAYEKLQEQFLKAQKELENLQKQLGELLIEETAELTDESLKDFPFSTYEEDIKNADLPTMVEQIIQNLKDMGKIAEEISQYDKELKIYEIISEISEKTGIDEDEITIITANEYTYFLQHDKNLIAIIEKEGNKEYTIYMIPEGKVTIENGIATLPNGKTYNVYNEEKNNNYEDR